MPDDETTTPEIPTDIVDDPVDDYEWGVCTNCGYRELRAAEELEPGSRCKQCGQETFGAEVADDA